MCQSCSSNKHRLEYLKNELARVCDQCFNILEQKSKSIFLLTLFAIWQHTSVLHTAWWFSSLYIRQRILYILCIFTVLNHSMLDISVDQMRGPQQKLFPLETEQPSLSPGSRRRYLQPSKRWLVHCSDQDALLFIMTRQLIRRVLLVSGVSKHTQLLHEWVSAEVKGR